MGIRAAFVAGFRLSLHSFPNRLFLGVDIVLGLERVSADLGVTVTCAGLHVFYQVFDAFSKPYTSVATQLTYNIRTRTRTARKTLRAFRPHAMPGLHAPRAYQFFNFCKLFDFWLIFDGSKNSEFLTFF